MQDLDKLLPAFASVARTEIRRDHLPGSCVASTWITLQVMRRFGISGHPLTVKVNVYNASFVRHEQRLGRRPTADDAEDIWVVGVGFQKEESGLGTHVVAVLDDKFLVDAAIDQANDPEHGIVLPGVVWGRINSPLFPLVTYEVAGQRLTYILTNAPIDFDVLYDWSHNPQTDAAVARILAHLKDLGFVPST